jgi:hypothetical protein
MALEHDLPEALVVAGDARIEMPAGHAIRTLVILANIAEIEGVVAAAVE